MTRKFNKCKFAKGAPIFTTAVMEFLAAEILELAGNEAKQNDENKITPAHIRRAFMKDPELSFLERSVKPIFKVYYCDEEEISCIEIDIENKSCEKIKIAKMDYRRNHQYITIDDKLVIIGGIDR